MDFDARSFKNVRALVIGDLMIDEYLWGSVERVSPEAPVQVVAVTREDSTLGGAGNVVNNLVKLGANVLVAGVVGTDSDANLLRDKLKALGVATEGVFQDAGRPTTRKTRVIAAHQHVLRIDRENLQDIAPQILRQLSAFIARCLPDVDVVLISDYGKGLLTSDLLTGIFKATRRLGVMTLVDPKGTDYRKYAGAFLLTPNQREAALAAGVEITNDQTRNRAAGVIMQKAAVEHLLITCGAQGMMLYEHGCAPFKIQTRARQVFDVSGAGDTVLATLGAALASGSSLRESAAMANAAAGLVVEKVGTATVSLGELDKTLKMDADELSAKMVAMADIPSLVADLRGQNKRIVLTNGCFDLLHTGHIMLLRASRKLGDALIVAIDDDPSVSRLKGAGRPVIGAYERARLLCALDCVDYVVPFSTQQLEPLIEMIRPNVLTKGSNYGTDQVFGRELVERHGGRVELIPVASDISSTQIIANIQKAGGA